MTSDSGSDSPRVRVVSGIEKRLASQSSTSNIRCLLDERESVISARPEPGVADTRMSKHEGVEKLPTADGHRSSSLRSALRREPKEAGRVVDPAVGKSTLLECGGPETGPIAARAGFPARGALWTRRSTRFGSSVLLERLDRRRSRGVSVWWRQPLAELRRDDQRSPTGGIHW